jgi:hypothetical protein
MIASLVTLCYLIEHRPLKEFDDMRIELFSETVILICSYLFLGLGFLSISGHFVIDPKTGQELTRIGDP